MTLLLNDPVFSCFRASKTVGYVCLGPLREVTGQGSFLFHSFLRGRQHHQLWQLVSGTLLNICEKKINLSSLLRLRFL